MQSLNAPTLPSTHSRTGKPTSSIHVVQIMPNSPAPTCLFERGLVGMPGENRMNLSCPSCESNDIIRNNKEKNTGTVVGGIGGAVTGAASALSGARIGSAVGALGGPAGIALGGIAGALFGGLLGAATGSVAGAKIGERIDEHVLQNYQCFACGHQFSTCDD